MDCTRSRFADVAYSSTPGALSTLAHPVDIAFSDIIDQASQTVDLFGLAPNIPNHGSRHDLPNADVGLRQPCGAVLTRFRGALLRCI